MERYGRRGYFGLIVEWGRPSAPLVAAGVFVIVESAAACVVGVADHWTSSSVNTLVFVVLIVAVIVSAVAAMLVGRQGLSTPTAP